MSSEQKLINGCRINIDTTELISLAPPVGREWDTEAITSSRQSLRDKRKREDRYNHVVRIRRALARALEREGWTLLSDKQKSVLAICEWTKFVAPTRYRLIFQKNSCRMDKQIKTVDQTDGKLVFSWKKVDGAYYKDMKILDDGKVVLGSVQFG